MSKVQSLEERIAKRKERIEKLTESLKKERKLLKADETRLGHLKYDELLKKLMENDINPEQIIEKVDEVIIEEEIKDEGNKGESENLKYY